MAITSCLWIVVIASVISVVMVTPSAGIRVKIHYKLENVLTCYSCPEKSNNTECNKWAPDVFCPYKHTVCKTVHRFNKETDQSTSVEKSCALPEQCTVDMLGCMENGNQQECVSCCSESYCNKAVPTNVLSSIQLSDTVILNAATSTVTLQSSFNILTVLLCSIVHRSMS